MRPVRSSHIRAVGWDADVLEVEFKSGVVWRYRNVPIDQYNKLVASVSVGSYFEREIKSKPKEHPAERVHDPREVCTCRRTDAWRCLQQKMQAGSAFSGQVSCSCYCHRARFGGGQDAAG